MRKSCFLFGHADTPDTIIPRLDEAIENCYSKGIVHYYVGNRGRFDSLAASAVLRAKKRHKDMKIYLLLAYHPAERPVDLREGFDGSYYPPLEGTPRQYTIVKANRYMVCAADAIICYVCHVGNTRKLLDYAQRRKKHGVLIENLAENNSYYDNALL